MDNWAVGVPPPPGFSQVFILKRLKVLCFETLLQVFILKTVIRASETNAFAFRFSQKVSAKNPTSDEPPCISNQALPGRGAAFCALRVLGAGQSTEGRALSGSETWTWKSPELGFEIAESREAQC